MQEFKVVYGFCGSRLPKLLPLLNSSELNVLQALFILSSLHPLSHSFFFSGKPSAMSSRNGTIDSSKFPSDSVVRYLSRGEIIGLTVSTHLGRTSSSSHSTTLPPDTPPLILTFAYNCSSSHRSPLHLRLSPAYGRIRFYITHRSPPCLYFHNRAYYQPFKADILDLFILIE